MKHIIWDWNGTLLNDLPIIIKAVNQTVDELGIRRITLDDYRTFYTRPVKVFYDQITQREIEHAEWQEIDRLFHENYRAMVDRAGLAAGAEEALVAIDQGPHAQSLLSMSSENDLAVALSLFNVERFFEVAQGNSGPPGGFKAELLGDHLTRIPAAAEEVTMIGDTVDDAHAARENGIAFVIYDDGSHHRHDLDDIGVPVTDSIAEAVKIALS
jgi:phosphoglycolate phosphatase-like HAD superfamily hydrolase